MTRAFVAGATGYVGRSVVAELCARGVETWAHVRPDSSRLVEWSDRFAKQGARVDTTAWDVAPMQRRLTELSPTVVFALLGTTRARSDSAERSGGPPSGYEAVDYGLTAMLLQSAAELPGGPLFVYLSAAGVSPDSRSAYLSVRARIERELRDSGLHYVIARPAFVTGDDRDENRPVERWSARVGDAVLSVAALLGARTLRNRWSSITGHQLARGLVRLALDPATRDVVVHSDALRA